MIPRFLRRLPLAVACVVAATTAARAAAYYATDGDNEWRSISLTRPISEHLVIEQILNRADSRARVVAVEFRFSDHAAPPLADCAHLLRRAFARGAGPDTLDGPATALARAGHELRFPLVRDGQTFACELFVYAEGAAVHGLVCSWEKRADDGAPAPSVLARLHREAAPAPGVVALAPLRVAEDAISSFPISFKIIAHRETHRVVQLIVTEVLPSDNRGLRGNFAPDDTDAIETDDVVLAIDGRPATEFNSAMGRNTELGRIFLNRRPGETVHLQLRSARTHAPYEVTLQVRSYAGAFGR